MSQRNDNKPEPKGNLLPSHPSFWRPLRRTFAMKRDLDKELMMLQIIDTTDKVELNKLVKGKK